MNWSPSEKTGIVTGYWRDGNVTCPKCTTARLDVTYHDRGPAYFLTASCPKGCANDAAGTPDDPLRESFRDYTEGEQAAALESYFNTRSADCPVCHASFDVEPSGLHYNFFCLRCRKGFSKNQQQA